MNAYVDLYLSEEDNFNFLPTTPLPPLDASKFVKPAGEETLSDFGDGDDDLFEDMQEKSKLEKIFGLLQGYEERSCTRERRRIQNVRIGDD